VSCGALGRAIAEGARKAGMAHERITECSDAQEAIPHVLSIAHPGDVVLVKGSRGMRMEQVVDALRAPVSGPAPKGTRSMAGKGAKR
jgi:UDP-N-acetylmuramoyl-tripeptide--D-alanyl-D-alanine ligase